MAEAGLRHKVISDPHGHLDTRPIEIWLVLTAVMVALTAVIGAATRLTGSGLSITQWQPILGVIPPLGEAQWHEAFERYKAIPQYAEFNHGMSLAAFKAIFWWEWMHRLVARGIGVVFAVPFVVLAVRGRIPRRLLPRLLCLLALGGLQGAIGWFMVMSGLSERTSVSPYRLALHLGCAVLIFAALLWTVLELAGGRRQSMAEPVVVSRGATWRARGLVGLIYLQVLAGALVAGHKAGLTYNTWPLMDGRLVPAGLGQLRPWWLNVFENVTTVQFDHRALAYVIAVVVTWHWLRLQSEARAASRDTRRSGTWLAMAVLAQMGLGIWTLLAWVPLPLGVLHQAGALALLGLALWHLHALVTTTTQRS